MYFAYIWLQLFAYIVRFLCLLTPMMGRCGGSKDLQEMYASEIYMCVCVDMQITIC